MIMGSYFISKKKKKEQWVALDLQILIGNSVISYLIF